MNKEQRFANEMILGSDTLLYPNKATGKKCFEKYLPQIAPKIYRDTAQQIIRAEIASLKREMPLWDFYGQKHTVFRFTH